MREPRTRRPRARLRSSGNATRSTPRTRSTRLATVYEGDKRIDVYPHEAGDGYETIQRYLERALFGFARADAAD